MKIVLSYLFDNDQLLVVGGKIAKEHQDDDRQTENVSSMVIPFRAYLLRGTVNPGPYARAEYFI